MIDGVCGRESVRFEHCAKMLTASQYGQLKQSLAQLAKESANKDFNKADVSIYAYILAAHALCTVYTIIVRPLSTFGRSNSWRNLLFIPPMGESLIAYNNFPIFNEWPTTNFYIKLACCKRWNCRIPPRIP